MKRGGERSDKVLSELEPYYIGPARSRCRMQRQYFSHEFSGATGLQPAWLCKENSNNEDVGGRRFVFKRFMVQQSSENVESKTENRSVGGSIPPLGTILLNQIKSRRVGAQALRLI
jgi:hypothetical protein